MSPRFSCATLVMENVSSDLQQAIISYWTELHLEPSQTSTMEPFCENSQLPKDVDHFRKQAPPQMFDWIPNAPPVRKVL